MRHPLPSVYAQSCEAKIDFLKKKREKNLKERDPPWRKQGHTDSFLHLRAAHLDNKPVDPAT